MNYLWIGAVQVGGLWIGAVQPTTIVVTAPTWGWEIVSSYNTNDRCVPCPY